MSQDHEGEPTQKLRREQARAEREALEAAQVAKAAQRKRLLWIGGGVLVLAVAIVIVVVASSSSSRKTKPTPPVKTTPLASLGKLKPAGSQGPLGPEHIPIPPAPPLADTTKMAAGEQVDGIQCLGEEQVLFHIHAHLTVFVAGAARQVPYGIGITSARVEQTPVGPFVGGGGCFYWLHTHAADGIIHIESPVERIYTLGDFFDIWGQPLSATQVGPIKGKVTALYNGQVFLGDPREIPLTAHAQIQLDVGTPLVAPVSLSSFGSL